MNEEQKKEMAELIRFNSYQIASDLIDKNEDPIKALSDACIALAVMRFFLEERNLHPEFEEWAAEKIMDVQV